MCEEVNSNIWWKGPEGSGMNQGMRCQEKWNSEVSIGMIEEDVKTDVINMVVKLF